MYECQLPKERHESFSYLFLLPFFPTHPLWLLHTNSQGAGDQSGSHARTRQRRPSVMTARSSPIGSVVPISACGLYNM